jgi:hypothetical protein
MSLEIKRAVKFIFDDKNWLQKIALGGVFYFVASFFHMFDGFSMGFLTPICTRMHLPILTLPFVLNGMFSLLAFNLFMMIVFILLYAIPKGYIIQSMHNEINSEEPVLPEWESALGKYFRMGVSLFAINLIYLVIIGIISIIPFIAGYSVYALYPDNPMVASLGMFAAIFFCLPFVFIYTLILPFIVCTYAEKLNVKDAFKLDRIFSLIFNVLPEYLLTFVLTFFLVIVWFLLSMAMVCTCVGIVLMPFLILPMGLISMNLFAQTYKLALQNKSDDTKADNAEPDIIEQEKPEN